MKVSNYIKTSLLVLAASTANLANAAMVSFDLLPTANIFGQNSLSIVSGDYTLTITATSGGNPAKLAQQTGSNGGVGIKLDTEANNTWGITGDETLFFTVSDSSGAVAVNDVGFKTTYGNHLFGNERATISINSNSYELQGGVRGTDNASAPTFDGANNATGASWATELASSFSLSPAPSASGNATQYRLIELSVNVPTAAVPVPAAAWLFGSALVGLATVRRKHPAQ